MSHYSRVLVTGGCGFIGSHFIKKILEREHVSVLNIDVLTYAGNTGNLSTHTDAWGDRYTHVVENICNVSEIENLVATFDPEVVIHFAAESHVDRSYFDAYDFIKTNIEGTRVILEAVRKHNPRTRFIHISTDEIYGDVEEGEHSVEVHPMKPSNLYAASKAGADQLVQAFTRTHTFPAIIVRGSNNYGTHQYPEKLIPMTITSLLGDRKISVHGNGGHQRSWLHVQDFCAAILLIMDTAEGGTIWNVSGDSRTNLQVIQAIADVLELPLTDRIVHVPDRPGADLRYAPSSDKLQKNLGWSRSFSFDDSIPAIVAWYIENKDWWTDVQSKEEFISHFKKQAAGEWL
ncbi:MAG: dTDP-glucose 4,6-dehydratase [Parcubacteria group bacterium]|nr:dTDP-glucose 4,6-dehydratase [Parcubacteria group bacterium]